MIAYACPSCPETTRAPPVALEPSERVQAPVMTRALKRSSLMAMLVSCALHAAPLGAIAYGWSMAAPLGAGEEVIDLDMIIAEDEMAPTPISQPTLEPPDPNAVAPSVDAAQAPDTKPDEKPVREDNAELHLPEEKPDPKLTPAEQKVISVASAAPPATVSEQTRAALNASYRARLAKHLARFKRFPAGVRRGQTTGKVMLTFALNPDGRVESLALMQSSGATAFDSEALAMIRRAEPFPRPPEAARETLSFTIPVSYRLRD